MYSDEEMWDGMLQGNQELFLALYNKYYHSLLFVGLKQLRDASLVKDTIQQLFLTLWEKRANIGKANNVKSYLITSFLRRLSEDWEKNARISSLQVVGNDYSNGYPLTPEESLIIKDEKRRSFEILQSYLNELPARQRELIFMKFYEGLSYDEIVQQTGLSHRTVYNKIHEALKKLRLDIAESQNSRTTMRTWLPLLLILLK